MLTIVIALSVVAALLYASLAIVAGMLIGRMNEIVELEEENSRLRFKLIDASRYMARTLDIEYREEGEDL